MRWLLSSLSSSHSAAGASSLKKQRPETRERDSVSIEATQQRAGIGKAKSSKQQPAIRITVNKMVIPVGCTAVDEAQKAICSFSNNLKCTKWEAKLPFIGSSIVQHFECEMEFLEHSNLLDFCKEKYKGLKIYFNPDIYPSPSASETKAGMDKLRVDLERVAHSHGYNIVSNGRKSICSKVFLCQSYRAYKSSALTSSSNIEEEAPYYRSTSLHNDKKNSRGSDGRSLSRRTKSVRPLSSVNSCRFRFTLNWDPFGIFFCCGIGSAEHNHYQLQPAEMCFPSPLLEGVRRETLKDLGGAYANCGVGRNYLFRKDGLYFSRSQVRYLYNDDEFIYNKNAHDDHNETPPGNLLKYFAESHDVSYCVLGNMVDKTGSAIVINELRSEENINPLTTTLDDQEYSDLLDVTSRHRGAYGLTDNENLFVAVAWVYTGELRLLHQFPYVIKVDDTSHTNNEKRPHLTFTAQTSSGKVFTWLRVFLPNKSAGCFRWIFSCVLPKLIGNEILQNIRLAVTDGDSQETSQLDAAIRSHFPRVVRVRCGWHLVEKGWQTYCPGERSVSSAKKADFKALIQPVKSWLYSWMRPGFCETEDEYHI